MARFRAGQVEIQYDVRGQGSPLLLIHGLGSSGGDWEFQLPALEAAHRVVTWDLRGHGKSSRPSEPYSMTDFSQDAAALLEHLGAQPAHVVGISLGGMVAFQLGLDRPELVRSLTIVNSGPAVVPTTAKERLLVWSRFGMLRVFSMARIGRSIASRLFPRGDQQALRNAFVERMSSNDKASYRTALKAIVGWSVLSRLDEIQLPVLVVAGDRDYTPVSVKARYTALLSDARLRVVADSGHATPMDQPKEFNRVLLEFLAEIEGARHVSPGGMHPSGGQRPEVPG